MPAPSQFPPGVRACTGQGTAEPLSSPPQRVEQLKLFETSPCVEPKCAFFATPTRTPPAPVLPCGATAGQASPSSLHVTSLLLPQTAIQTLSGLGARSPGSPSTPRAPSSPACTPSAASPSPQQAGGAYDLLPGVVRDVYRAESYRPRADPRSAPRPPRRCPWC